MDANISQNYMFDWNLFPELQTYVSTYLLDISNDNLYWYLKTIHPKLNLLSTMNLFLEYEFKKTELLFTIYLVAHARNMRIIQDS